MDLKPTPREGNHVCQCKPPSHTKVIESRGKCTTIFLLSEQAVKLHTCIYTHKSMRSFFIQLVTVNEQIHKWVKMMS